MLLTSGVLSLLVAGIVGYALIGFPTTPEAIKAGTTTLQLGGVTTLLEVLGEVTLWFFAWLFVRKIMTLRDAGLVRIEWRKDLLATLLTLAALAVLFVLLNLLHMKSVASQVTFARSLRSWWEIPVIALAAGFFEEIVFRGYLLRGLGRMWPSLPWLSLVISSVAFAVFHFGWSLGPVQFLAYIAVGGIFAFAVQKRGTLWPAMIAHAVWDGVALVLLVMATR